MRKYTGNVKKAQFENQYTTKNFLKFNTHVLQRIMRTK